jgi:hypothetical protein
MLFVALCLLCGLIVSMVGWARAARGAEEARAERDKAVESVALFLNAIGVRRRDGKPELPGQLEPYGMRAFRSFWKAMAMIEKHAPDLVPLLEADRDERSVTARGTWT